MNIIEKAIDKQAPLWRMSRKQRKLVGEPWITKGILTSIRKKIQYFELISSLEIQWKKTFFGVTRTCLQTLNP